MNKAGIWTGVITVMLLMSACGASKDTSNAGGAVSPAAAPAGNAQQVTITASNWKFDQPEYHVKKGQPVQLTLKNASGVHGLEVEKLGIKLDNKTATKTFTPETAGKYNIVCTIPCGTDHLKMKAVLVVD